jgi:hypothetical protein
MIDYNLKHSENEQAVVATLIDAIQEYSRAAPADASWNMPTLSNLLDMKLTKIISLMAITGISFTHSRKRMP